MIIFILSLLFCFSTHTNDQQKNVVKTINFQKTNSLKHVVESSLKDSNTPTRALGYLLYDEESTSALLAGEEYISESIDIAEFSLISFIITGTPSHASGNIYLEFSPDNINWDRSINIPVKNLTTEPPHTALPVSVYFRVRYINGPVDQDTMRLQVIFHRNASKGLTARLEQEISSSTDVDNVRAVSVGRDPSGAYTNTKQDGSAFRTTTNLGGTTLSAELTSTTTGAQAIFTDVSDFALSGSLYIGTEFIGYSANNLTNTLTITERGLFGSTPATHAIGSIVGEAYSSGLLTLDGYTEVATKIICSNTGQMRFQWYSDSSGASIIRTLAPPYATTNLYDFLAAPNFGPYVRYTFANTQPFATTHFFFETEFYTKAISAQVLTLDSTIINGMTSNLTRSIIAGRNESGEYENVQLGPEASLNVTLRDPITSFDVLSVASVTALAKVQWPYSALQNQLIKTLEGSGTITSSNSAVTAATGTTLNSFAQVQSKDFARYQSGQGMEVRFGATFSTPVAGTQQIAGLGDQEEGVFVGYNGTDFGLMRRYAGQRQIHILELTNTASQNSNVTIELNGTSVIVAIANNDTRGEVGKKIADADYSSAGFTAVYTGDKVIFVSNQAKPYAGVFSVDDGPLNVFGTFTQLVAGNSPTEEWTYQSQWNKDKGDGNALLPVIDFTKSNVFRIRYKWLGVGTIEFSMEEPSTGKFVRLNIKDYSNEQTDPFLTNPSAPLSFSATNTGSASNVTVSSSSMSAFVEGQIKNKGQIFNATNQKNSPNNQERVLMVLRVPYYIGTQSNKTAVQLLECNFGTLNNKHVYYRVYRNPTLIGAPSFSAPSGSFLIEQDTTTTNLTDGTLIYTACAPRFTNPDYKFPNDGLHLNPGEMIAITASNVDGGNAKARASITWREEI